MNLQIEQPNSKPKQLRRRFEAAMKRPDAALQRLLGGKQAVIKLIGSPLLAEEMKNVTVKLIYVHGKLRLFGTGPIEGKDREAVEAMLERYGASALSETSRRRSARK